MSRMGTHRGIALLRRKPQMVGDVNTAHDQDTTILFDLTNCLGYQASFAGRNLARFQRAPEGASQSARRSSHQVVQGRSMRLLYLRINTIMFGDLGMNPEEYGVRRDREVCPA